MQSPLLYNTSTVLQYFGTSRGNSDDTHEQFLLVGVNTYPRTLRSNDSLHTIVPDLSRPGPIVINARRQADVDAENYFTLSKALRPTRTHRLLGHDRQGTPVTHENFKAFPIQYS